MNSKEKPIILGLDTSCNTGSLAITEGDRPIAELTLDIKGRGTESLVPSIDFLLAQNGYSKKDLDLVAVSIGPGSYTGLRVGLSTAKGISYASGIPIVSVGTLRGLASRLPLAFFPVAPVVDAHSSFVYSALYKWGSERIPPRARKLNDFLELLPKDIIIFTGIDLHKFQDRIKEELGERAVFAHRWARIPSASVIATMGYRKFLAGKIADTDSLTPEYLRDFMSGGGREQGARVAFDMIK